MKNILTYIFCFCCLFSFSQELNTNIYAIDGNSPIECDNSFIKNEKFVLEYNWTEKGNFVAPKFKDLIIIQESGIRKSSTGSSFSSLVIVNGKVVENINNSNKEIIKTKTYVLKPTKTGRIRIPAAELNIDSKNIKSNSINVYICDCDEWEIYEENPYLQTNFKSELYIGEQTQLIAKIKYSPKDNRFKTKDKSQIIINNVYRDPVSHKKNIKRSISKDCIASWTKTIHHEILTPIKVGTVNTSPLEIQSTYFDFNIKKRKQSILKSKEINLQIKELPEPIPKNFYGTVSKKFSIRSEIDRTSLKTSEAISFKVIFRGEGNINMLEPFELEFPSSFEVFDPTITDETYVGNNNTGGTKTFEYTIIPRKKGDFTIPEIKFNYFNPKTEKYIELKTKEHLISVEQGKQYMPTDTTQNSLLHLDLLKNSGFSSITKRQFISKWYSFSYWIIFAIIIISYLVYFILSKRSVNPIEIRRRKSTKIAIKRLRNARFCLKNGNFDQFFEEIEKSLWGYFADKFKINSSELSKETIDLYFDKRNIKTETKNNFVSLLNICEFARYSPSKDRNLQMERTLEEAKEIIIEVESDIKKK
mgnify:CR=1 FL=1